MTRLGFVSSLLIGVLAAGPCNAAGVLFTCFSEKGWAFNLERSALQSGNQQPGWAPSDRDDDSFVQLLIDKSGNWDIARKTNFGKSLYKNDLSCQIYIPPSSSKDLHIPMDMLLTVTCDLDIGIFAATFLFATRNDVTKLLMTGTRATEGGSGSSLSVSDCRKGE